MAGSSYSRAGQSHQHQPMNQGQLHNQASVTSLNSNIPATSPSPISQRSENKLSEYLTSRKGDLMKRVAKEQTISDALANDLKAAVVEFKQTYSTK